VVQVLDNFTSFHKLSSDGGVRQIAQNQQKQGVTDCYDYAGTNCAKNNASATVSRSNANQYPEGNLE
jgi:hypothetical protein